MLDTGYWFGHWSLVIGEILKIGNWVLVIGYLSVPGGWQRAESRGAGCLIIDSCHLSFVIGAILKNGN
jgi:hypothetical protein